MQDLYKAENQIHHVTNFEDLISTPFQDNINAICWTRKLKGDFSEIVSKIKCAENITVLDLEDLLELNLTEQGKLARETLINDLNVLQAQGAAPVLNLIKYYEKDETLSFFPTDVYSFHVDRSPIPTSTFLCTYYGESSEILPNKQAQQKILVPQVREELRKIYNGADDKFESFLSEHFFDLHYNPKPGARPVSLGVGNLWRLAVDHPQSPVPPCIHRAPIEKSGKARLLLIC